MDIDKLFDGFEGQEVAGLADQPSAPPAKRREPSGGREEPPTTKKKPPPTTKKKQEAFAVRVTETLKATTKNGRSMQSFSVLPADYVAPAVEDKPPAKTYPFELDPFQEAATKFIEQDESVLVAAHTSAGKTVVAEYAIAKSFRDNQRVIYTSPIKALSNQKFRDLQAEFDDVGLMTGDVSINPQAKCLVMTTEILRSMLYRGSELCREVKWVIFDEIHYMRDKERGVVWEESIVLLPHSVRLVFLSATIPNAAQFASWIATIHRQPTHVVYTDYRPTPLVHYAFARDGLHLVVDEESKFRANNFDTAVAKVAATSSSNNANDKSSLTSILSHVRAAELQPCIVFAFSKAKCEKNLQQLKEAQYNSDEEAGLVRQIYAAAMTSLSEEDRKLPQVASLVSILERGVGIHHGGLLPLVKEVVEILFQEGLIKVLFATETFAIGINMPAKSVVFTELRKFDGSDFRLLSPSEYIQMSGRAGRRGKDDRGTVILMLEADDDPPKTRDMLLGNAEPLNSSYHVTYNMLLNLLRVQGADPEHLVRSSFRQFQQAATAPALDAEALELQTRADEIAVEDAESTAALAALKDELEKKRRELAAKFYTPSVVLPWLQPGRLVEIDDGWAIAAATSQKPPALHVVKSAGQLGAVPLSAVRRISAVRVFAPPDLQHKSEARAAAAKALAEVFRRFPPEADSLPLLDDAQDLKLQGDELAKLKAQIGELERAAEKIVVGQGALPAFRQKSALAAKAREKRKKAKDARNMVLKDEVRRMRRVLRRLEHVAPDGVIALKGRAACELNTADELVSAQLLLGGAFQDLEPADIAALLSCLVFAERKSDESDKKKAPALRPRLAAAHALLLEAARAVCRAKRESNVDMDETEYLDSFNADMMPLVFEWANGAKFVDLTKLTDAYEGTVVRVIRRLDELLRQLASAAHAIGNFDLKAKFEQASASIKRDIVFAASLYL